LHEGYQSVVLSKKGSDIWIKISESSDRTENFPFRWDTTIIPDSKYEILGMMHIFVKNGSVEHVVARQNVVEVSIKN